jgi:putative oxidoreductase
MYNVEPTPSYFVPPIAGFYAKASALSWPLVRIVVGLFLMPHGAQKLFGLFGGDINATAGLFSKIGIEPALPLAYVVGCIEFFGGLLLVLGLFTRVAAAGVVIMMAVAVLKVHLGNGFFWTKAGYEYPLMWGLLALAIFFRGGGEYSLDRSIGKEF